MTPLRFAAAFLLLGAGAAMAAPLALSPASPQPSANALKPGLSVEYAYPADVRDLKQAKKALSRKSEAGPPLAGLDYWDTEGDEVALTSQQKTRVAASISGYVRFDAPGTYTIDFLTNDGLAIEIGGQEVMVFDERTPCESTGSTEVSVPSAGWYALSATYFQRDASACLHMRSAPTGQELEWMPNSAFAYD